MSGEDWDLQWAPSGPGVRLQGSPLWFDVWPRNGVGFLSSLDALGNRRIRGQVICSSRLYPLLRAVRPRARVLPLEGVIGLGSLRLSCWLIGTTPGASGLLVERQSRRLAYLADRDARTIARTEGFAVPEVDTVLWSVALRGLGKALPPGTLGEEEGLGSALRRLMEAGQGPGVIPVSPSLHVLCRVGRQQGLALPRTRVRETPLLSSAEDPLTREGDEGPVREEVCPSDLLIVSRRMGARRLVLAGPGAPQMQQGLAGLGVQVETLAPPVTLTLL